MNKGNEIENSFKNSTINIKVTRHQYGVNELFALAKE